MFYVEQSVQMKQIILLFLITTLIASCQKSTQLLYPGSDIQDQTLIENNQENDNPRLRYKRISSPIKDKTEIFRELYTEINKLSDKRYAELHPLIIEQNIPNIQRAIAQEKLTYEELTLFYLKRIYKYELDPDLTLNTIISLNSDALKQARKFDKEKDTNHPIYGMPILLKDNINTAGMNTTAGAAVLQENDTDDAYIVKQLKANGAIILGKLNLSEWAYYFCDGCPLGYSAIGGQTLNPYGRGIYESGGSSAGSGTATAANYAVATVGTETSGSILSPSSLNSIVGLKPTIGFLSRNGIIPISSTLDTPGPMTKSVIDNAILLDAMRGPIDPDDPKTYDMKLNEDWYNLTTSDISNYKLGAIERLTEDSIYLQTINTLEESGALTSINDPESIELTGFLHLLNIDMNYDLPEYIQKHVQNPSIKIRTIEDIVDYNSQDSSIRMPYDQGRLDAILSDTTSPDSLIIIKTQLKTAGRSYLDQILDDHDVILSINNYHAGYAAVAEYPALTIPMGYESNGQPINLTLIAKSKQETLLYDLGYAIERILSARQIPEDYQD